MSERTSVLIDMGDLSAPIGSVEWTRAVHLKAKAALNDNEASRELVERWVGSLRQDNRFRCLTDSSGRPYLLWSAFCKDRQPWGLGYSEEAIDAILAERTERESARERCRHAAEETTGEVLPAEGYVTGRIDAEVAPDPSDRRKGAQLTHPNSQSERARVNGIGRRTQQRLDRLARDFPALHAEVKAGKLSVHAATLAAGIAEPAFSCPLDPEKAARLLVRHFRGEALAALIRGLADRAGPVEEPAKPNPHPPPAPAKGRVNWLSRWDDEELLIMERYHSWPEDVRHIYAVKLSNLGQKICIMYHQDKIRDRSKESLI